MTEYKEYSITCTCFPMNQFKDTPKHLHVQVRNRFLNYTINYNVIPYLKSSVY